MPFTHGSEARITRRKGAFRVRTGYDRWQDCATGVSQNTKSCAADMNVCISFKNEGVLPVIMAPDTPTTRHRRQSPFRSSLP